MAKVKKLFGENPEKIAVLDQVVEFDENGEAEVGEAVAEVLEGIPGYEVEEDTSVAEESEDTTEGESTPAPKKQAPKAPRKPAPKPKA